MPRVERGIVYTVPCPKCSTWALPITVNETTMRTSCCGYFFTDKVLGAAMSPVAFLVGHVSMN